MVVIALTEPGDAHIELIQPYLSEPIVVIGSQTIDDGGGVLLSIDSDGVTHIAVNGVELNNVTGVWYRKPRCYEADAQTVPAHFAPYVNEAQQSHYALLRGAFSDACWISDFYAIRRMDNKYLQLNLAKRCGFRIPETLFTADSTQATSFINKHGECIVKTLVNHFPEIDGEQTYFFAKKLSRDNLPDLSGLHLAPAIFQQLIMAKYDTRIVVVGNKVFGSIITNKELDSGDIRDWRLGHIEETIQFKSYVPPVDISEKCIAFTRQAGLKFSAFDFVVDQKGNHWFIEDNPNGQWGFVETATQQAIAREIACMLETGHNTVGL